DDLGRVELIVAGASDGTPSDGTPAAGATDARAPAALPDLSARPGLVWAESVTDAPPGVLGLLRGAVIADDLDAAGAAVDHLTRSAALPITIITRAGDVFSDSVLRGGSGARRSRLELVADRDAAADAADAVRTRLEQCASDLAEARTLLAARKTQAQAAAARVRDLESRTTVQAAKTSRATVQLEAATAELNRLSAALLLAAETVAGAEAASETASAARDEQRVRPRPVLDTGSRDALYAGLERARESEVEARLQAETARERVRAAQARADALEKQQHTERAAAEESARRAVIRRRQVDVAGQVAEALPLVLASVDASVSAARMRLAAAETERSSQNAELAALRREDSALRARLQAVTETVHGLELAIYEKKLHLSGMLERAISDLGLTEDVLVSEYGPDQPIPSFDPSNPDPNAAPARFDREDQQRRLAVAERRYAQLGRVNPLALEEFAALEQRHRFLTEQLTDLTSTRRDLLTIIDEIDEKMGAIFGSAFDDTQAAFAEVFPVLFPGGSGSIRLTDPDNLLTTGIEVSVKPAGKKIERLSLLSGGERSLAAVALLIAIFKARPSPFYIMDEVEAALDDANLGRLLTIFEDLRATSQLIVITHQKRTMEIADALYGVSMRLDGVSAVVGQRIAKDDEQAS
ncbi:chromosome segregation protein SMC, partial [Cryobacterium cheniae]